MKGMLGTAFFENQIQRSLGLGFRGSFGSEHRIVCLLSEAMKCINPVVDPGSAWSKSGTEGNGEYLFVLNHDTHVLAPRYPGDSVRPHGR
jgi:hypothetical protein